MNKGIIIGILIGLVLFSGIAIGADPEGRLKISKYQDVIGTWNSTTLTMIDTYGTVGAGDDQFSHPKGIYIDDTYFYVADTHNHRIKKHYLCNNTFVSKIGSLGTGNDQFNYSYGITGDDTFLYIADTENNRIKKHYKSNLSYHSKFGSFGTGDDQFQYLSDITCDDTYLYITDRNNDRIKKHFKFDLSYHSKAGTTGSGYLNFNFPTGITIQDEYLYIVDRLNHRIKKYNKNDLSYANRIGSEGSGNDQFKNPTRITSDETYFYVFDPENHRLKTHLLTDLSYHNQSGLNIYPYGICYYEVGGATPHSGVCDWSDNCYDFINGDPGMIFGYIVTNPNETLYNYNLTINDTVLGNEVYTEKLNLSNVSMTVNTTGWCTFPHNYDGLLNVYFKINGTFVETLDGEGTEIINSEPVINGIEFDKSEYDTRFLNTSYKLNYSILKGQEPCYTYKGRVEFCLTDNCDTTDFIRWIYNINSSNTSLNESFYTTDSAGKYKISINGYNLSGNLVSTDDSDIITLNSYTYHDYYLAFSKSHYNTSEGTKLTYNTLIPLNSTIEVLFMGADITEGTYNYPSLVSSGAIHRDFSIPGFCIAYLKVNGTELKKTAECAIHEASNSIHIYNHNWQYPFQSNIGIAVSSPTEDLLYIDIYNSYNTLINTIEVTDACYTTGLSFKYHSFQPTDASGTYTIKLREIPDGEVLDSETFYLRVCEYNVSEVWFSPNEILQGDDMNLYYYVTGNSRLTVTIRDLLGLPLKAMDVNQFGNPIPIYGVLTYSTSPTISVGQYKGTGYYNTILNCSDQCNISSSLFDPNETPPKGIDAFIQIVNLSGFGSTAGKMLIAAIAIILVMFYLGKSFDAKIQMLLAFVLIIAFIAIGFIPVWAIVIVGLIVAAMLTFNIGKG